MPEQLRQFDAPEPEADNLDVKCVNCGTVRPVSEMAITMDGLVTDDEGDIEYVQRGYICADC